MEWKVAEVKVVTGTATLREVFNEVFGKAHLRASGSDFQGMIN